MSRTLTDSILELVEEAAQGGVPSQALKELLDEAIPVATQQKQTFQVHGPRNPEFGPELAREFEVSLTLLESCFQHLRTVTEQAPEYWAKAAAELRQAVAAVRTAQQKHQERIEDGPTTHLFLNRLLLHLNALHDGQAPSPMTLALLAGLPLFEMELRHFIEEFEEEHIQATMAEDLGSLLETCNEAEVAIRENNIEPHDLYHWTSSIVQYSQDLDEALARVREEQLNQGPTTIPLINLALAAVDRHLAGNLGAPELLNTLDHCRAALAQRVPSHASDSLVSAHQELDNAIREARDAARSQDQTLLDEASDRVFACADRFALEANQVLSEDEQLNILHHGGLDSMPVSRPASETLLGKIASRAEACLEDPEQLGALHELTQALERQLAKTSARLKPGEENVRVALSALEEAHGAIASFQRNPNRANLAVLKQKLDTAEHLARRLAPKR